MTDRRTLLGAGFVAAAGPGLRHPAPDRPDRDFSGVGPVLRPDGDALTVDVLHFVPRARWDALRTGTATYPEDDALDAAIAWMTARAPFGILRCSARRLPLIRPHALDVRSAQLDFTGPLDFSRLPPGTPHALQLRTRPVGGSIPPLDALRSVARGLRQIGNGEAGATSGILYEDCDHLVMDAFGVRGFATNIRLGQNAYCIDHRAGVVVSATYGFHAAGVGGNSGERITFADTTFGGLQTAIHQDNAFGDTYVARCSFDYPNDFTQAGGTGSQWVHNRTGRLRFSQCHFEGNHATGNRMGGLPAFHNGGDGTALSLDACEIVFDQPFRQYLFRNDNSTNPLVADAWIYNAAGVAGRIATGAGQVQLAMRNPQGGGATTNGGLLTAATSPFLDGATPAPPRDVSIVHDLNEDGSHRPRSPTAGRCLRLSTTVAGDEDGSAGGHATLIDKALGAGTPGAFAIAMPIRPGTLATMAFSVRKPGRESGPLFFTAKYAHVRRDASDVVVIDREQDVGSHTLDLPATAMGWTEVYLGGSSVRAPGWANAFVVVANLASLPAGRYLLGRKIGTQIG